MESRQCTKIALFGAALTLAPGLFSATEKDRFATLIWWANRSCFFLWFHRGNTLFFQSVTRQILYLRGCLKVLFTSTNTARVQGWGNPRGSTPLVLGVQGPGGSWRIFRGTYAVTFQQSNHHRTATKEPYIPNQKVAAGQRHEKYFVLLPF